MGLSAVVCESEESGILTVGEVRDSPDVLCVWTIVELLEVGFAIEAVEAVEFVVEEDGAVGTGAFESGLNVVDGEFRASWGAATELVVGFEVG